MLLSVSDLRDPYNANLTTTATAAIGDIVLIGDYPLPGRC